MLLSAKTGNVYSEMLRETKNLFSTAVPATIMINLEKAIFNPRPVKNNSAVWLNHSYDNDTQFSLKMRMLNALAFVPLDHILETFDELK